MLYVFKPVFLVGVYFVFAKCLIPDLSVKLLDNKLIERKRQDTFDMCRLFTTQNENLKADNTRNLINNTRKRYKRETAGNDNEEDAIRVENIVDKLYEDLEENGVRVTYMKRKIETSTLSDTGKKNKPMRRFNFAPAELLGPTTTEDTMKLQHEDAATGIEWPKRWTHGILPYFIDSKTYDTQLVDVIIKAFDYFEKTTCIRLQRLKDRPTDKDSLLKVEWLYITNPNGIRQCVHSNEQRTNKGVQMVVFGYDCMSLGEIIHEVMHILGYSHEHTRPDRDQFVTVLWNNIKPGYKKYFESRSNDVLLNIQYDYDSVLHYPARAFSRNGQITLISPPGTRLGQRNGLSKGDVEKVSIIYGNECMNRNRQYLQNTCPSVVKTKTKLYRVSTEEINNYFKDKLWPYGIVNFKLKDRMQFSAEERENIKAVIRHIEKETCIEFNDVSVDDDEEVDVEFDDSSEKHLQTEDLVEQDSQQQCSGSNKKAITSGNSHQEADFDENRLSHDQQQETDSSDNAVISKDSQQETYSDDPQRANSEDNIILTSVQEQEASSSENKLLSAQEKESDSIDNDKLEQGNDKVKGQGPDTESRLKITYVVNKGKSNEKSKNLIVRSKKVKKTSTLIEKHGKSTGFLTTNVKKQAKNQIMTNLKNKPNIDLKRKDFKQPNATHATKNAQGKSQYNPNADNKTYYNSQRKHAADILVLARSVEPGCPCPTPGTPGGHKMLYINADCFNSVNDLLHLFVHFLGLDHQHNMHDRDSYLHILWDKMTPDIREEMKVTLPPAASLGFDYDYQSVMHYPWLQIKNGVTNVMYPIWNDGWSMGHWQGLSSTDVKKINLLYRDQCSKRKLGRKYNKE